MLYNEPHNWKADTKKIQKRGFLVKYMTATQAYEKQQKKKRSSPSRRENNLPMPAVVTRRVGWWKDKSCTGIYATRKSMTCKKTNELGRK